MGTIRNLEEAEVKISSLQKKVECLELENQELRARIDLLLRERFGRKTEQVPPPPDSSFDEPELTAEEQNAIQEEESEITVTSYSRKPPKRKPLPPDLPRVQEIYDLKEEEKICACGSPLHCIGEEKSEKLDIIPAKIQIIEQIRKKYACRACEEGIQCAQTPPSLLPRSIATPGLLSYVVVSKYEDHLPLYRQEAIWRRLGIDLPRSTLCHWVLSAGEALNPLLDIMREEILRTRYVQADETPVQILNEKEKKGTKKGYMWAFLTGNAKEHPAVCYRFSTNRKKENATEFFENYQGILQTDGFAGYEHLSEFPGIIHANCWVHARRPFYKITQMTKKAGASHYIVNQIQKLYKIEQSIPPNLSEKEIQKLREEMSAPIIEEIRLWLLEKQVLTPPKGLLGQAISYVLARWEGLTLFLKHGRLKLDTNDCENIIRPFTLGRKNWLFVGNERGGAAAANLYSLIQTCRLNRLNAYAYLRFLFSELPRRAKDDKEELRKLLPQYCSAEHLIPYLT